MSSQSSSSPPRTPRSRLRYATIRVRKANKALKSIEEFEVEDTEDDEIKEAAKDLGNSMTEMRKGLKSAQGNVDSWKGPATDKPKRSKGGVSKAGTSKATSKAASKAAPKRMIIDPSAEVLAGMSERGFLDKMREMHRRPGLKVTDWIKYALDKSKATATEDASLGFYLMAQGISVDENLEQDIGDALGTDLEDELMAALDATRVSELGYEELWDIFESTRSPNPRNKKHRVELLQYMIQCVENIRFSMAWLRLTNGDDPGAISKAVQETYAFGSVLIICPLMRIAAFHDSRTGVAINDIVKLWKTVEEEFVAQEKLHNEVLKAVISVLEGLYGRDDLGEMVKDMELAYFG
ncbi:unnamed protein product [Rhizoctonia solani]|uniref:Uncharacterized protein n=1 Tax=Rhizoctonia solani TaxID=456999 RepID=A0A8H3GX97_9AGAM|nr:unnamed protein product [Rhizoctonia solani]